MPVLKKPFRWARNKLRATPLGKTKLGTKTGIEDRRVNKADRRGYDFPASKTVTSKWPMGLRKSVSYKDFGSKSGTRRQIPPKTVYSERLPDGNKLHIKTSRRKSDRNAAKKKEREEAKVHRSRERRRVRADALDRLNHLKR